MPSTGFDRAVKGLSKAVIREALPVDLKKLIDRAIGISDGKRVVQVFDSSAIASRTHVLGAYLNALLAFKNHTNRAKSIGMEMLLFVSLTDQIDRALEIAGAKPDSKVVVFASGAEAFSKIAPMLKGVADFDPGSVHQKAAFRKLNVRSTGDAHDGILQAMAVSRLGP
jgi:tRNA threonylcarbamoyladenosine modification (KEOPS) complex Cgi121 subunit